jgi:hypothetical protein
MTSLPHYVPYLHVRRKVYSEKENLVTMQTLLKFFSHCVSFWGLLCVYVRNFLKAGTGLIGCPSEGVSSGREGSKGARIKVINLVCWLARTDHQHCLVNMIQMSMRIKRFTDEQNFIKEKQSYVFSE